MRRYVLVLWFLMSGVLAGGLQAEGAKTYYFQLICGSNKEFAPNSGVKPVGSKLRSQLETTFRWKSYGEVTHGECTLGQQKVTTIKLPDKREMQLELSGKTLEARLYRDSHLVRKTRASADSKSIIMGGDQGKDDSWFIVIRHDKPSTVSVAAEEAKRTD